MKGELPDGRLEKEKICGHQELNRHMGGLTRWQILHCLITRSA